VIGLGSMGKRRVRNLKKNGETEIFGFDNRKDRAEEVQKLYGITTFTKFEDALKENPEVLVISCPPDKHMEYAYYAAEHNIHFFTEVNTDSKEKIIELIQKINGKKIVAAPSCTMRFHPCVNVIKELVDKKTIGKPLLLTYHSGSNLEDWHPWEKISDYYVGKKETGGGRDQIMFELEWIKWILGDVRSVRALTTKLSQMEADIFDVYDLILEFENNSVANVLVDMIQRPPNRILRIVCENGIIHWDWMSHMVKVYNALEKKWMEIPEREGYDAFPVEEMYEAEMRQFLKAVKGEENYPTTFENEIKLIETMYKAEKISANS